MDLFMPGLRTAGINEESVEPISFICTKVVERPEAKINVPNTPHSNRYEVSEGRMPPFTYI